MDRHDPHAAGTPRETRLADYRPPAYLAETVALEFDLHETATRVCSRIAFRRNPAGEGGPLFLNGAGQPLERIALDGEALGSNRYPPDVMARYAVTITADATACPVMLSNGNPGAVEALADGRHRVVWTDPHPKPCYLFALVAGDLVCVPDRFRTRSGREVALGIYVRRGDEGRCAHAMRSLKTAMRWDEEVFGLEYDLDVFNIAAVSDFNMGAMENKGLNVFNTRYVLADPATATDSDYQAIESVIAHEYFHNWTGNRVTCRDWFQLSLKEGLTV